MKKGIAERVLERGARAIEHAAGNLLAHPRGQEAVAKAVGAAQRGLQLLGEAQGRMLHAAGLAAKPDYQELRKQVARLKRKAREIAEQLESAEAKAAAEMCAAQPPPPAAPAPEPAQGQGESGARKGDA